MSKIRRIDIAKTKKEGEKWFALRFPENLWFWDLGHPWTTDNFKDYPIHIEAIKFSAGTGSNIDSLRKFTKKKPCILKCGCDVIGGSISTTIRKKASFTIKPDSIIDLNKAMIELSELADFTHWQTSFVVIYNSNAGVSTEFQIHNPNCKGEGLYTYRFQFPDNDLLYFNVPIDIQQKVTGGFCDEKVTCSLVPPPLDPIIGCGGKLINPKPIVVKRKITSVHLQ